MRKWEWGTANGREGARIGEGLLVIGCWWGSVIGAGRMRWMGVGDGVGRELAGWGGIGRRESGRGGTPNVEHSMSNFQGGIRRRPLGYAGTRGEGWRPRLRRRLRPGMREGHATVLRKRFRVGQGWRELREVEPPTPRRGAATRGDRPGGWKPPPRGERGMVRGGA